ncbi:MAG: class I SAM-dependent methyltransferase [Gemmatimonadales bacterium]
MNIYDPGFVERLFDEMAATYEAVNYLSSFGFSARWRRQLVRAARIRPGTTVCDLMCGMGECWPAVASSLRHRGRVIGLDLSQGMLAGAARRRGRHPGLDIELHKQDVLANALPDGCADSVVCGFGLKTFTPDQWDLLAAEIHRLLKPRGTFALIEVSVPAGWMFKDVYLFYLKRMIPLVGRLLLGNPDNYRLLGRYTEQFGDCEGMLGALTRQGLDAKPHRYFFGCATGISGARR